MEEVEETTGSNRYGRRAGAMARMSMKLSLCSFMLRCNIESRA
jgi:hypothetical protein